MVLLGLVRHLGHKNILEYDNRPFDNITQHDIAILKNYNDTVEDEDDFYYLGDFSFASPSLTEYYISSMKGNKFFIKGNHDKESTIKLYKQYGTYLGGIEQIEVEKQKIILCHYSLRVWSGNHRGTFCLYGHSHHSLERYPIGKSMDVGIPSAHAILGEYRPFSFEEIKSILDKREVHAVDHHIRFKSKEDEE